MWLETRANCEQDLLVTRHAARARLAHLSESTAESENKEATLLSAVLVGLQWRAEFKDSFQPDSSCSGVRSTTGWLLFAARAVPPLFVEAASLPLRCTGRVLTR